MTSKIRKAVIPAAGYGTRLFPVTKVVPKELIPIGNKPAIQYVVEEAVASGIEEIILVCHPSKTSVFDYFKPDPNLRDFLLKRGKEREVEELERIESLADFRMASQEEALGLGHAVWCAREEVGDERFFVMLPDVFVMGDIPAARQLLEACSGESDWGLLLEKVTSDRISSYGIIRGDRVAEGRYRVTGAVEKPLPDQAPSDLGILGRYLFPPSIFEGLEGLKKGALREIQLTDAIDALARKSPACGVVCRGKVFDVGTPSGLREAYRRFEV